MKKRDYFIQGLLANSYRWKAWVLECFSVVELRTAPTHPDELNPEVHWPYQQYSPDGVKRCFVNPATGQEEVIEDAKVNVPLFDRYDDLTLAVGELPNVKKQVETCYGNALFNAISLVYSFGDVVEFKTGEINIGKLEDEIAALLKAKTVTVEQLQRYYEGTCWLEGFSQLFTASSTPYTVVPHPEYKALKKRLLEENKDHLEDPVVMAKIQKELATLDREWIAKDPEGGFIRSNKDFDITRAKTFYMYGLEANFNGDGGSTLIKNSLSEGWDPAAMPAGINALREGSFSRGAMTALGGEAAKTTFRMVANTRIVPHDCGTKVGEAVRVNDKNFVQFIGKLRIDPTTGKQELLTSGTVKSFVGKLIYVRSPMFCKQGKPDFCLQCMGEFIRGKESALALAEAQVSSTMMLVQMKKAHGVALRLVDYSPELSMT